MNRQQRAAARIGRRYGVRVEWASANREYVVDGRAAGSTAKRAEQVARRIAREARP